MSCLVLLCTYNGADYLPQFLASLTTQRELPQALLVRDDGSTDGTHDILTRFAASAPFPVNWRVRPRKLGSTGNFAALLAEAAQDYPNSVVALADQDDLWLPEKVAVLRAAFADATVGAVFTNAELISADGASYAHTLWQAVGFGPSEQVMVQAGRLYEVLLQRNVVTGATFACRSHLLPPLLPIPDYWVHDAWLALLFAAQGNVVALPQCLIRYRQHCGQQHGAPRWRWWDRLWYALLQEQRGHALTVWLAAEQRRYAAADIHLRQLAVSAERLRQLDARRHHLDHRLAMRGLNRWARLPYLWHELRCGSYHRFANGWMALLKDYLWR